MNEPLLQLLKLFDIGPTAVAVITLIIALAPKALATATDWNDRYRCRIHNKDYLQILKLRCEIQALIKNNGLDENFFALPPLAPIVAYVAPPLLSKKEKFLTTSLGAVSPIALYVVYKGFMSQETGFGFILAIAELALELLVVSALVGTVSMVTPLRRAWHAYLFGFSLPILLVLVVTAVISRLISHSGGFGG